MSADAFLLITIGLLDTSTEVSLPWTRRSRVARRKSSVLLKMASTGRGHVSSTWRPCLNPPDQSVQGLVLGFAVCAALVFDHIAPAYGDLVFFLLFFNLWHLLENAACAAQVIRSTFGRIGCTGDERT